MMADARARFFDNMERELLEQVGGVIIGESTSLELEDFDLTLSAGAGTTATPITSTTEAPSGEGGGRPAVSAGGGMVTSSSVSSSSSSGLKHQQHSPPQHAQLDHFPTILPPPPSTLRLPSSSAGSTATAGTAARSIPVPKPNATTTANSNAMMLPPSSLPSSQGSSGSAFLNSVLNQNYADGNNSNSNHVNLNGTIINTQAPLSSLLSHTPPTASSYELQHNLYNNKRLRSGSVSGSVSGRMRSASELLDDNKQWLNTNSNNANNTEGMMDQLRSTKMLLKDLILIGDEQVQVALDQFELTGDSSLLEQMIASGTLQHRVPADLDILDDLDLDFLNVHEEVQDDEHHNIMEQVVMEQAVTDEEQQQRLHQQQQQQSSARHPGELGGSWMNARARGGSSSSDPLPAATSTSTSLAHQRHLPFNMVSPPEDVIGDVGNTGNGGGADDGIGDFEFNEFADTDDCDAVYSSMQMMVPPSTTTTAIIMESSGNGSGTVASRMGGNNNDNNNMQAPSSSTSLGTSPQDVQLTEYEQRMRSNSLFSALLNDKFREQEAGGATTTNSKQQPQRQHPYPQQQLQPQKIPSWMDRYTSTPSPSTNINIHDDNDNEQMLFPSRHEGGGAGIRINRTSWAPGTAAGAHGRSTSMGGIAASLLAAASNASTHTTEAMEDAEHDNDNNNNNTEQEQKPRRVGRPPKDKKEPKESKKTKKSAENASSSASAGFDVNMENDSEQLQHPYVSGSGLPRSLSDPNLLTSHDSLGLRQVERPDGWVGAYSPESRRVRIDRFLAKRNHRVWSKTIKYDVRKNFADSRLRVKGRFVRKEDELLMRELMSLT